MLNVDFIWIQQLFNTFITIALLFVAWEYNRRYHISFYTKSIAAATIYNNLRVLFLLLAAAFAFKGIVLSGEGKVIIIFDYLGSAMDFLAGIWATKIALGHFFD